MLGLKKTSILLYLFISFSACAQNNANSKPNKINMTNIETITLGSGCFWCTEAFFQRLKGVVSVTSGYSGGFVDNPTYEQISLDEILSVFWKTHDPTTLNQQGNDIGPQYRSVVFFHNKHQEDLAKKYIKELDAAKAWPNPIVTTVEAFEKFYAAENYHQNYYNNNKNQGYCRYVIGPKLEKFEKVFADKLIKE
jgi:peptide-methionine (S)-S-oxide reductase